MSRETVYKVQRGIAGRRYAKDSKASTMVLERRGHREMNRDNFYILLGLSYDPPEADPAVIKVALRTKKQEWARWQDHAELRSVALTNLGLLPEAERVMLDPELRALEAEDAMAVREEMLLQFEAELRILESKGYILPREVAAIAVRYKPFGVTKDTVAQTAHCPISDKPVAAVHTEKGEILDRETARAVQRCLTALDFRTLYAFLDLEAGEKTAVLHAAAERKYAEAEGSGGKKAVVKDLATVCMRLFADEKSRQRYDRYLEVDGYPALCDMIDAEFDRYGCLNGASMLRLVNFGVEKYAIRVLEAEEVVRRYSAAYDIPVGEHGHRITCPSCGNKTDRNGAVCTVCAQPLRGTCPGCGSEFEEGPSVCSGCGFVVKDMAKALYSISDAENALIECSWGAAQRYLAYAKKYWPGHPKLALLEHRAAQLEEKYAHYVDNIGDCVSRNQYYAAKSLILEAKDQNIHLPPATVVHVDKTIADLETGLADLRRMQIQPSFEHLMTLAATVSDSMELTHMMRRFPPEPPQRLAVGLHGRQVRLTWSVSTSPGMKDYIVVRKAHTAPLTAYDGEVLYEGPANSFIDKTAEPLCDYYYGVYTRRAGAVSVSSAAAGPVLLAPDVQNLRILPVDMGAQLSWDFDPNIKEVQIWRKLGGGRPEKPGEGYQLESIRLDGYTDGRLKNSVEYWYYVVAVYYVGGQKVMSPGVSESVVPHKMLAPIENLIIARSDGEEDEYVASWQGSHYSDVLLFATAKKPSCRKGEMHTLTDLMEKYTRLHLDAKQPQSARFRYAWNGGIYIFPAAISGKFATIGETRYFAKVCDVQNPIYEMENKDILLRMDWPEGLSEVVAAYRFDNFAQYPTEPGTNLLRYSRERYEQEGGIRIPDAEGLVYYVTIFSIFVTPEKKRIYSPGVNLLVDNTEKLEVFYKIGRNRKLFTQTCTLTLSISASEEFTLPRATVVAKVGRMPLSKNDGIPLFELERETRVEGSVVYEYRASSLPDNLHVRFFFQDESLYDKINLLPTGSLKIT